MPERSHGNLRVFPESEVRSFLEVQRSEVVDLVEAGYRAFGRGEAVVPHSAFLRLSENSQRIIALPAFIADQQPMAGLKWVASFPGNHEKGLRRANATMILNCAQTGYPLAFLEATSISAHRTAASAALAARALQSNASAIGVVGCGPIAWECIEYLNTVLGIGSGSITCHDLVPVRATQFAAQLRGRFADLDVRTSTNLSEVLERNTVVLLCTTSSEPYVEQATFARGATVLHVSLRDLGPRIVLANRNIVDDFDHVCRQRTSIELAFNATQRRDFVAGPLHEVLDGRVRPRDRDDEAVIFSPFGLGILDLVLARWLYENALDGKRIHGIHVPAFTD